MGQRHDLFGPRLPPGFAYTHAFVTPAEEDALLREIVRLPFSRVEMRGVVAKRRTVHYGYDYGYERRQATPGEPLPEWLQPLRARAAAWAAVDPEAFEEALVTEYTPGAPIGWHRDAPMFDVISGISLGAACRMKLRPYVSPRDAERRRTPRRTTHDIVLAPRSAYLIRGIARREYEHSIPPVSELRYSITFRTVRGAPSR